MNNIKELRKAMNFNRVEMGEYLGVTHHAIRKWESEGRPLQDNVLRMLTVLETVKMFAPDVHAMLMPVKKGSK